MYIATRWNPIYWNTACLIVNSGSLEETNNFDDDDNEEIIDTTKKTEKTTDYAKIAKALGEIIARGIKVSLVDINKSNYSFEPDVENNEILFGMKALGGVNGAAIDLIIKNRPYDNIADFMLKCGTLNKTAMIALIKSGAFDKISVSLGEELGVHPRVAAMAYYLSKVSDQKKRITLQNVNGLIQKNLLPQSLAEEQSVFEFNKFLKAHQKIGRYYQFNNECTEYYNARFDTNELDVINGVTCILQTRWDRIYQTEMDKVRDWIRDNQETILKEYNQILFKESWDKYATGNISAWEMEALCFYYHEHELAKVNTKKYGLVDFDMLAPEIVDYMFKRNGKDIPIYKIYRIAGTVISKNDARSSISLLTTTGVVTVKFSKEYYAMAGRQISELGEDGVKHRLEKSWFTRGTKLLVQGFRRDDTFVAKRYANTAGHQLYKINKIEDNGDLVLQSERANSNKEENEL